MTDFIVAIVTGGLFTLLVLIWFASYIYNKSKEFEQNSRIQEMYNSDDLAKMDYDFTTYDDETARLVSVARTEGQLTIEDVLIDTGSADEGLEEITGNYKPD